ncbi:hypothetical protein PoB_007702300 [Plakobranchus ocellatus]|uniref:Uncharacterized protein n=1 Tax=Plakobranchus ocellatus TaxID=259542 RepID=A0AAV4E1L7_9GAST|nr:hypothetical protein PoB_007702300 [Plakobranchus ocellatus]
MDTLVIFANLNLMPEDYHSKVNSTAQSMTLERLIERLVFFSKDIGGIERDEKFAVRNVKDLHSWAASELSKSDLLKLHMFYSETADEINSNRPESIIEPVEVAVGS